MFFDGFCCRICCMSLSTRFCDGCFIFCRGEWHSFGQMERLITVFTNIAHCINQKSSFNNLHQITSNCLKCNRQRSHLSEYTLQGRIQDFKLGGAQLKKIAPSGGRREKFWGISCEKSRFYAKKIIFFPILGGGAPVAPPPPESAPALSNYVYSSC
jgi:hypothetical protein